MQTLSLQTSAVRQLSTWQHGQVRWKWSAVYWGMERWWMPWPGWVICPLIRVNHCLLLFSINKHISPTGFHIHTHLLVTPPPSAPVSRFVYTSLCFSFFYFTLLKCEQTFHPSNTGGPDSSAYCITLGKNWYCPVAAAAHGPSRCSHHKRLHPPPHFSQGGPVRDCCSAAGGWSLTFTGHEGEQKTELIMHKDWDHTDF